MRALGPDATYTDFRLDLVFTKARLTASDRPELVPFAADIDPELAKLVAMRAELEAAEDQQTILYALLVSADASLDKKVDQLVLSARLRDPAFAKTLFGIAPSDVKDAPIDRELQLVREARAKIEGRPADDPLRAEWLPVLDAELAAVSLADVTRDTHLATLSAVRGRVLRAKLGFDEFRASMQGRIQDKTRSKKETETYFRAKPARRKKKTTTTTET